MLPHPESLLLLYPGVAAIIKTKYLMIGKLQSLIQNIKTPATLYGI